MNLNEKIAAAKRNTLAELMSEVVTTFLSEGYRLDELLEALADYTHQQKLGATTFHLERAALSAIEERKPLDYAAPITSRSMNEESARF